LDVDVPIAEGTFNSALKKFQVEEPGDDRIVLRHHFYLPDIPEKKLGVPIYHQAPWTIYRLDGSWIYLGINPQSTNNNIHQAMVFNDNYTAGNIYNMPEAAHLFQNTSIPSLTLSPSDQILLARVFAQRQACFLHACGMVIQEQGLAFVGHSEAGKTTTARMLMDEGELLCDDRIIIRHWTDGFRVHGTWSHGDIPKVSASSAPLRAVFLLEQAPENRLIQLEPRQAIRTLPEFVIKPLVTRDWWENILDTLGKLVHEVPIYRLRLDKSGAVKPLLRAFLDGQDR
jgi:hypothetical protein